ncbi:hypothetical protein EJ08DRAFT_455993 [Tothia fuscella]|uniref:F-box domain-containing protein n=1 Tax=Tothia fuscella TaxID=1048955 RepID=A0A9P4NIP6_9PEZI|nr:hypothetical protein EJ08DRAFT_455993 [Tothia fuscella]
MPQDLLAQVASYLFDPFASKKDLSNFAAASPQFAGPANTWLYRDLYLHTHCSSRKHGKTHGKYTTLKIKPCEKLEVFLRSIIKHPELAIAVKDIRIDRIKAKLPDDVALSDEDIELFKKALAPFHALVPANASIWMDAIEAGVHAALIALILCLCRNVTSLDIPCHYFEEKMIVFHAFVLNVVKKISQNNVAGVPNIFSALSSFGLTVKYTTKQSLLLTPSSHITGLVHLKSLQELKLRGRYAMLLLPLPSATTSNTNITTIELTGCSLDSDRFRHLLQISPNVCHIKLGCAKGCRNACSLASDLVNLFEILRISAPSLKKIELLPGCRQCYFGVPPVFSRLQHLEELSIRSWDFKQVFSLALAYSEEEDEDTNQEESGSEGEYESEIGSEYESEIGSEDGDEVERERENGEDSDFQRLLNVFLPASLTNLTITAFTKHDADDLDDN